VSAFVSFGRPRGVGMIRNDRYVASAQVRATRAPSVVACRDDLWRLKYPCDGHSPPQIAAASRAFTRLRRKRRLAKNRDQADSARSGKTMHRIGGRSAFSLSHTHAHTHLGGLGSAHQLTGEHLARNKLFGGDVCVCSARLIKATFIFAPIPSLAQDAAFQLTRGERGWAVGSLDGA
jgi:hypothetical protein